jgi:aspartate-semialdehyde dehydrogenase
VGGKLKVAIVGATGAVGRELLSILQDRDFPVAEIVPFASSRSAGREIQFGKNSFPVRTLEKGCFEGIDIAFFDASDAISKEWVPEAAESGAWVVDNSATFRMEEDVFLLVPEINGGLLLDRIAQAKNSPHQLRPRERIVAGPNCSTVQLVLALHPIRTGWGLERVVVSTYQSTSGAGSAAMEELTEQTHGFLKREPVSPKAFSHQIAFNCIPQIGGFKDDGFTSEEQKIIQESRKILGIPDLRISATAIRVPTLCGHGESVNVDCLKSFEISDIRAALEAQPGIRVQDDPERKIYPMNLPGAESPVEGAAGRDAVYVGRIRKDHSAIHGLHLWVVSDNLRKGAALNAVQIGEILVQHWF